jgi:hypothetical protein
MDGRCDQRRCSYIRRRCRLYLGTPVVEKMIRIVVLTLAFCGYESERWRVRSGARAAKLSSTSFYLRVAMNKALGLWGRQTMRCLAPRDTDAHDVCGTNTAGQTKTLLSRSFICTCPKHAIHRHDRPAFLQQVLVVAQIPVFAILLAASESAALQNRGSVVVDLC